MKSHENCQGYWRKVAKDWGLRAGVVLLATLWLILIASSWADAKENKEDDEYNFNWLDPDKKIYVLQNRKYLKAKRLMLSAMIGPGWSNPYKTTFNIDPRAAYYLSESFGIEVFYQFTMNKSNSTLEALERASTTVPIIREIKSQTGILLHWVPWYAKINVFNKILYFDWYFAGGAGSIRSDLDVRGSRSAAPAIQAENPFAVYLATGHQYHLTHDVTVRLDVTGAFYRGQVSVNSGDKSWYSNYNFGFGLGLRL